MCSSDLDVYCLKLVTLKKDVPVKNKIEEFELKSVDQEKLYTFLREMEFNRLLSSAISKYGGTNNPGTKDIDKNSEKTDDITSMTLNEYEIYIDDYTKKSKYPDISK